MALMTRPPAFALPTELSEPSNDFGDYTTLLYGEKKIGKTSMCAYFPDAYYIMFEPGGRGLRIRQTEVNRWEDFQQILATLKQSPGYARTIIVDTVDKMYESVFDYKCRTTPGMTHPTDLGYGKGWKIIEKEFTEAMQSLIALRIGLIVTSHAQMTKLQKPNGTEFDKMTPTMPGQAAKYIMGVMDNIAYYGYYGPDRFITVQGSETVEAGTRCNENFFVKGTYDPEKIEEFETVWYEKPNPRFSQQEADIKEVAGENDENSDDDFVKCEADDPNAIKRVRYSQRTAGTRVHSIPCGNSPRDTFVNLQKAFRNEQETDGKPSRGTGMSEKKVNAFVKK